MKTAEEREKILKIFDKKCTEVIPKILEAEYYGERECRKESVMTYCDIIKPVIQMYATEMQDIINPLYDNAVPAVLTALKVITNALEQKFPDEARLSKDLAEILKAKSLIVTVTAPKED